MKEIDYLPNELRQMSICDNEIIVPYEVALEILSYFHTLGYAALGYEILKVLPEETLEIRTFVSYFPDSIIWEEFVDDAYGQVKSNLEKTYEELLFSDEGVNDLFILLTFVNRQEFETKYYEFVSAD